ncbi:polyprotein [Elysia marginata]|uniref:Polyprotein n=1 Tax=Elysia marginata TaxID=1093978 RepID=A0AAV4FRZ1_9GAST|nr:polyprotein [Elysia marginata]
MTGVIGQIQTDRKGLGSYTAKCWTKTEGKEKRCMIILEETTADLPEWGKHPYTTRRTTLRTGIMTHSPSTQQFIVVELTEQYESKMDQVHTYKTEKYLGDLTKELGEASYRARIMPIDIGAREFEGSSAFCLLSKLLIGGNKRTKT